MLDSYYGIMKSFYKPSDSSKLARSQVTPAGQKIPNVFDLFTSLGPEFFSQQTLFLSRATHKGRFYQYSFCLTYGQPVLERREELKPKTGQVNGEHEP